jgi:SSS family transporter
MDESFGLFNWGVLLLFLAGTTLVGHMLRGDTSAMRGFFLGGRSIPWWAVAGSLIATKTSALTFIAVPGFIFAPDGDLTYLQVTIGFILGNVLMALLFVSAYYREEIYSPYDFMGRHLGDTVGQLARLLFLGGVILSQAVRLLATAIVLSVITGMSTGESIVAMGLFAVAWAMIGGINTVIWTDLIQWGIFMLGAVFTLAWAIGDVPDGVSGILEIADEQAKLAMIDISLDPTLTFTLWVGLVGASIFELGQTAVDQVITQRALCCKNAREAKKAIYGSIIGVGTTYLLAAVGLALVAFYQVNPPSPEVAQQLTQEPDRILPVYVVEHLPTGLSGLLIAAIFAAGISTLDSALTALSHTTTAGFYQRYLQPTGRSDKHYVNASRLFIAGWGGVLVGLAWVFDTMGNEGLLELGLQVPGYVYGALLGIALLALWRRGSPHYIATGVVLSIIAVLLLRWQDVSFFWWYPVACVIVVTFGLISEPGAQTVTEEDNATQADDQPA